MRKSDLAVAAEALNSGAIHLLRAVRVVDREAGLTPARLSALSVLVYGGPCTLGRLATAEGVTGPTMTRIVDGLVALELAAREPHPDSARLVWIRATEEGKLLMERARARRVEALVAAMRALPLASQQRISAVAPLLEQLAGAMWARESAT
ncbi:MAG: MarR family winged helix-turn-helix transcriptional regulator [Acidimicrobiales bacterium]